MQIRVLITVISLILIGCSSTSSTYSKQYKSRTSNVILVNQYCYSRIHDHAGFSAAIKTSNNEFISFGNLENCIKYGGYLSSNLHNKLKYDYRKTLLGMQKEVFKSAPYKTSFPTFNEGLTHISGSSCVNERNKYLETQSIIPVTYKSNKQCVVDSGQWEIYSGDLNTGMIIETNADNIYVGHIVPWSYIQFKKLGNVPNYLQYRLSTDHNNLVLLTKSLLDVQNDPIIEYDFDGQLYNFIGWNGNKDDACRYIEKWLIITTEYQLLKTESLELANMRKDKLKYCH